MVSASAQPKMLNHSGEFVGEFAKGDPYPRDMRNTKGHIAESTGEGGVESCGPWRRGYCCDGLDGLDG